MEALFVIAIIGVGIAGAAFYWRAVREARDWKEVHAAWGASKRDQAVLIHHELAKQGITARLKTHSASPFTHAIPQTHASILVRREDYARAAQIVLSFTRN